MHHHELQTPWKLSSAKALCLDPIFPAFPTLAGLALAQPWKSSLEDPVSLAISVLGEWWSPCHALLAAALLAPMRWNFTSVLMVTTVSQGCNHSCVPEVSELLAAMLTALEDL